MKIGKIKSIPVFIGRRRRKVQLLQLVATRYGVVAGATLDAMQQPIILADQMNEQMRIATDIIAGMGVTADVARDAMRKLSDVLDCSHSISKPREV